MKTRFLLLLDSIRTSFWFVPAVMLTGAVLLALVLVQADRQLHERTHVHLDFGYNGGPEGARLVLSTIAGSMITVAGVVFSITIVALTLASSQFGPRVLRNFIRDRGNQFVLGTFVATFLYCLIVLRAVRSVDEHEFVPSISVLVGVALAIGGLGVLIYFIHHVATSIQASRIVANIGCELLSSIDRIYPEKAGPETATDPPEPALPGGEPRWFLAPQSGYIVAINEGDLMNHARQHQLVIRVERRAGEFVVQGDRLAAVWPAEEVTDDLLAALDGTIDVGDERSWLQDVEFGIDQLAEVALRALSPAINDPFTAVNCIDRLAEALCRLAAREFRPPRRFDDQGRLRLILVPISFEQMFDDTLMLIADAGQRSRLILSRLLNALERVAHRARRPGDRCALRRQAERIARLAHSHLDEDAQQTISDLVERVRQATSASRDEGSPGQKAKARD